MIDPFRIEGPAVVNVSGGRTSAYMLRRVLDACGGRLPADVFAVFCNTGDEREETLRFVEVEAAALVTLCECDGRHAIFAEEHEPTHGGPARRAYGYALDALLVGHGVPACEPGLLVREGRRDDGAERRAA